MYSRDEESGDGREMAQKGLLWRRCNTRAIYSVDNLFLIIDTIYIVG